MEGMEHLLDVGNESKEWRRSAKGKGRCSDDEMESEEDDEGDGEAMNDPVCISLFRESEGGADEEESCSADLWNS